MKILEAVVGCVLVWGFFAWIACAEAQLDESDPTAENECPGKIYDGTLLGFDGTILGLPTIGDSDLSCLNHASVY